MSTFGLILLQVATAATENVVKEESLSFFDLLVKGGYLMIPIGILSMIALYLFIERLMYISKVGKTDDKLVDLIKEKIRQGNLDEAHALCETSGITVAKIYAKGISRLGSPVRDIESILENMANVEVNRMEKNIGTLSAIAAIAPMIGFLGTVMGMIKSFHNISITNDISIGIIAGGIYEKMITSASGLIVGIIAFTFVTLVNNRINRTMANLEDNIIEFLDILYKPTQP